MDPKLWSKLPTELVRKIIEESEPTIDTRIAFKIQPKKLDEERVWRLWYLLKSHDGLVYNLDSQSLHIFRMPGCHIVRRPYRLNRMDQWMTVFNEEEADHMLEISAQDGSYIACPYHNEPFYTELRVLLRGTGVVPSLNVSDASF